LKKVYLLFLGLIGISNVGYADKRPYVWTYPYMLGHPGAVELEHYLTYSVSDLYSGYSAVSLVHMVEIETGITPYCDIAIYHVFKQSPVESSGLKYDSFKIRTRFAIAGKNEFFMDPILYLEFKSSADVSRFEGEVKFILSKDFTPDLNISLNPYYAVKFGSGILTEQSIKFSAGISYRLTSWLALSGEIRGSAEFAQSGTVGKLYAGPTMLIGTSGFRWTFGASFQIFDPSRPGAEFRSLLGFYF